MTFSFRWLPVTPARVVAVHVAVALTFIFAAASLAPAHGAQRPGAVRTIQIHWTEPFPGALMSADIGKLSITRAVFGVAQPSGVLPRSGLGAWRLIFTVEANGTRNLWQAVPELTSAEANDSDNRSGSIPNLRGVIWRATPLTRLSLPFFADEAAPTPDGRALLYVTNADLGNADPRNGKTAAHSPEARQIARLDLATGRLTPVITSAGRHTSPSVSPDGRYFAYVSDRSGMEAIYIRAMEGGTPLRVATLARNPAWFDNGTLLFESTRPGQVGLYRLALGRLLSNNNVWSSPPRPRQLFSRPGEVAVAQDGRSLCIAADMSAIGGPATAGGRQLFMLAPDGSGARSVIGTSGARSPGFAPDGQLLVFDAPVPEGTFATNSGAPADARTLWLMPMLRVLPSAQLREVRPVVRSGMNAADEINIIGTAFAEEVGPLDARLEYSLAGEPQRWRPLVMNPLPVHNKVLATWKPDAPGDWLLRLTVTDADGDSARSTLAFTWPLPPPVVQEAPPPVFARPNPDELLPAEPPSPVVQTPPSVPALPLPAVSPPSVPGATPKENSPSAPRTTPRTPRTATGQAVPILPLPALPPPPGTPPGPLAPVTSPPVQPTPPPAVPQVNPNLPVFPPDVSSPIKPSAPAKQPVPAKPAVVVKPRVATTPPARRRSTPVPLPQKPQPARGTPSPPVGSGTDRGTIKVSGTPAVINTGEKVPVEAVLVNTGRQGWSSQGPNPVRLIYHWVNLDSGTRVRWYIEWLTQPVVRGGSLRLAFDLTAPPRPGRYRLTYTLVRLQGETYEPPPYNARPAQWPGEFGATSYIVTVR